MILKDYLKVLEAKRPTSPKSEEWKLEGGLWVLPAIKEVETTRSKDGKVVYYVR